MEPAQAAQKDVAIAIAGHSVIIKKISVPPMTPGELAEQIPYEAEHHIPFAKDDVEIDYQVGQRAERQRPDGAAAGRRQEGGGRTTTARWCARPAVNPVVVDVAAFTAQNAFEANYPLGPARPSVLVNIGAAISNINIMRGGTSLFTRDVTIGGNAFTEEIQKQLNVSQDEAEAYKVGGSYDEHGVVPQEVERIIEGVAEVIAGEFQRSLDFFLATTADTNVSTICLSGGTAKVAALHRAIERRSRLPVEVARRVAPGRDRSRLDAAYLPAHSPEAMVGLGLALRAPSDKSTSKGGTMIKINLLAQKRPKRVEPGQRSVIPRVPRHPGAPRCWSTSVSTAGSPMTWPSSRPPTTSWPSRRRPSRPRPELREARGGVQGGPGAEGRHRSPQSARAVPAWLLHELSTIMTKDRQPTMSTEMAEAGRRGRQPRPVAGLGSETRLDHLLRGDRRPLPPRGRRPVRQ